jgi:hypothetical protein
MAIMRLIRILHVTNTTDTGKCHVCCRPRVLHVCIIGQSSIHDKHTYKQYHIHQYYLHIHVGPIGLVGGALAGVALTYYYSLNKGKQRKAIEDDYTRLIQRCIDAINDIEPKISDCEEQLEELKETVKSLQQ